MKESREVIDGLKKIKNSSIQWHIEDEIFLWLGNAEIEYRQMEGKWRK